MSRWLKALWRPSGRYSVGALLVVGGLGGVFVWGGFHTFVEYSNTMTFCTSCHEMRAFVFEEYTRTAHYRNASGVQATCADCHVPKAWGPKIVRKITATVKELPQKVLGSIDTREKFEAKRLEMAEDVWASMRATDSRECRNCHSLAAMTFAVQKPRARAEHEDALKTGETCIDCHRGVAHTLPKKPDEPEKEDDFAF
ncbi:MAG: NapC/NirT family cytochrome c [Nitrospiria bacterium]